jgi:penicillin-insensitive murein endopeptidase
MVMRAVGHGVVPVGVIALLSCLGPVRAGATTRPIARQQGAPIRLDAPATPRRLPAPPSPYPTRLRIWGAQRAPTPGPTRVYGRTTSGCIAGAVALPNRGEGFLRQRPWRHTAFGHPDLVDYVERLGEAAARADLGALAIGDMAQPRGGAFPRGHLSHQTGLDVDIAYPVRPASDGGRFPALTGPAGQHAAGPKADPRAVESLLRLAAADPRVDRIFVAADLKQLLCRTVASDRGFLAVLRPWQGHEAHFHVRLKCPQDSPECRPNEPLVTIPDTCEDLARGWKGARTRLAFAELVASESASYARDLPRACRLMPAAQSDGTPPITSPRPGRMPMASYQAPRTPRSLP